MSPTPNPATISVLNATESYAVKVALTDSSGNLNTVDPLERLSVLPNKKQPLLVELGVLRGGRRVLFALAPSAVVSGPGKCTPGPIDCEVLSLAPNQIEQLSMETASGTTSVSSFAVTGVRVSHHPSAAAATKARQKASADGRALLQSLTSPALALFPYKQALGAVLDLRNLSVGT